MSDPFTSLGAWSGKVFSGRTMGDFYVDHGDSDEDAFARSTKRKCATETCITILSAYAPLGETYCFKCRDELSERDDYVPPPVEPVVLTEEHSHVDAVLDAVRDLPRRFHTRDVTQLTEVHANTVNYILKGEALSGKLEMSFERQPGRYNRRRIVWVKI